MAVQGTNSDRALLWSEYWASPCGQQDGCLPGRSPRITQALRAAWQRVAAILPPGSAVLDVGTGNGTVLQLMQERRTDLRLVGVDLAERLPPAPAGIAIHAGVDVANLPFDNSSFAAVTSQFGIEYAALEPALKEVGRVLERGGKAIFITHHMGSPVLAQNLNRLAAIDWALNRMNEDTPPANLDAIASEAARQFGPDNPAWQMFEAFRRFVSANGSSALPAVIADMARSARLERDRIDALHCACKAGDDHQAWQEAATGAGLEETQRLDLDEGSGGSAFARIRVFMAV